MMKRTLVLFSASSLLLLSGLAQGLWTGRWARSHAVEDAVARLEDIPMTVGDWNGTPKELPPDEVSSAQVEGYRAYRFENRRKGQAVTLLLVSGRPGPVSVHTPDVCYQAAGFELTTGPEPVSLRCGSEEVVLNTATFRKEGAAGAAELRIFWAWNGSGRWQAPANPRWAFARAPVLYKLYVIREKKAKNDVPAEQDPAVDFLNLYLPKLNRTLYPAAAGL